MDESPEKKKMEKKVVKQQGQRKVPEAGDTYGCNHHGLLDLLLLPKDYLETFTKVGVWLDKKPCKDCAKREDDGSSKVLEVATLLNLKGMRELGYYCNCGPTGHNMKEGTEWKHQWTCDMVLCMTCYDKRRMTMGNGKRSRRRNQLMA